MAINSDIVSIRQGASAFDETNVLNETGHKNMLHLIHLRWLAVGGQIATILVATWGFGIQLPLFNMLAVMVCLIAFNIGSHLRWHEERVVSNRELFLAMLVDIASLTAQLYFTGGINNPFVFLFLLQVILSAVLLRAESTWLVVAITTLCLAFLSIVNKPLVWPLNSTYKLADLYATGLVICFVLNAALLVIFITRIGRNLRAGDAALASLRQRAAEEEHIVRMGLLASGAAHELGTPLATMSVVLGDWKRMPQFSKDPAMLEEIEEIEGQLLRCKSIVSGILLSAGETRGESSSKTSLNEFFESLVEEWESSRPAQYFEYTNSIDEEFTVAFDSTVKQMVFNVLDNALEVSPNWLRFEVSKNQEQLFLTVADQGPGFRADILEQVGTPYNSSKGRPGGGLGLFLVMNVARTLGGTLTVNNRKEGGAEVVIALPLNAMILQENKSP
ncbi:MAG: HAMP domain-containing histidine kinase [Limnobacter sp.]|jgi:two-component system, sensor histidine kinase RegB|uniref:histidine kinase n=1 Tax=Limnobacter profundi TaxID=2732163 RepID=A0ABX6N746_9BURK|nr:MULTISPECIES: ATP-binding protein [unclassified Limnobacter]MAG80200.1 histidine kinase [Sutterellaceae bacterium]PZO18801.1 MAG: histidine kinase [Betaproteobacteria bacterium]MBT84542.1 histidine kinase [Sutterellaceae bacterium]PZO22808.1 MAG: histidine kinase [Betaproteobacteria bacterium]QJR29417.1 HAMP domain-containing histidine kinase [Limnobacter sp. SAORIC-580]|tara:strand:- start:695 stop:2032 length:1338 start_codon:yes stop_codon:yes gene_type:complete